MRETRAVTDMDLGDDGVRRFVIFRYAFDPARRERRHQVVAVLANRRSYDRVFIQLTDDLERRRRAGEAVDYQEHYSGRVLEPGHIQRQRNARLLRRAVDHGVWPVDARRLDLPPSVSFFTSD